MKRLSFLLMTAAALVFTSVTHAAEVKIIANPSVSAASVSAAELKHIFLLEKSALADGSRVEPVVAKGGPRARRVLARVSVEDRFGAPDLLPQSGVHGQGVHAKNAVFGSGRGGVRGKDEGGDRLCQHRDADAGHQDARCKVRFRRHRPTAGS